MTTRRDTSIEGSMYELVARGQKDVYFFKDEKESVNPFDWRTKRWPSQMPEIRTTWPLNQPRFGQRCEWDFDLPADVLLEATLVIDLPTWLPPEFARTNWTSDTYDSATSAPNKQVYGYVNGIAYFLFERIQILQDGVLLQDVTGDSLYAAHLTKSSWNQGHLEDTLAGVHDGSRISIQRNATPGTVELRVPMLGCQFPGDPGLPLCGLRGQTFRLRVQLRNLEDLVETNILTLSDGSSKPAPWDRSFTQITVGGTTTKPAVPRAEIGQPVIGLRTKQLYLENEERKALAAERIEIPYVRYFDNEFGINALDYAPLAKTGGVAQLTKVLDARFTVERIITYFRNSIAFDTNRLWNFEPWYSALTLVIAGQSREGPWDTMVYGPAVQDAAEERTPGRELTLMNWSRGARVEDTLPAARVPSGGINFTTADRPTLLVTLTDIAVNPCLGYKQSFFTSCCESWALYVIEKGRGRLMYYN